MLDLLVLLEPDDADVVAADQLECPTHPGDAAGPAALVAARLGVGEAEDVEAGDPEGGVVGGEPVGGELDPVAQDARPLLVVLLVALVVALVALVVALVLVLVVALGLVGRRYVRDVVGAAGLDARRRRWQWRWGRCRPGRRGVVGHPEARDNEQCCNQHHDAEDREQACAARLFVLAHFSRLPSRDTDMARCSDQPYSTRGVTADCRAFREFRAPRPVPPTPAVPR